MLLTIRWIKQAWESITPETLKTAFDIVVLKKIRLLSERRKGYLIIRGKNQLSAAKKKRNQAEREKKLIVMSKRNWIQDLPWKSGWLYPLSLSYDEYYALKRPFSTCPRAWRVVMLMITWHDAVKYSCHKWPCDQDWKRLQAMACCFTLFQVAFSHLIAFSTSFFHRSEACCSSSSGYRSKPKS